MNDASPDSAPGTFAASSPLTGDEPFRHLDATVRDFWRYAMPDLRMNTVRGHLAEFLVARAVGATHARVEWDAYDVKTPAGITVEVKTSGYLQPGPTIDHDAYDALDVDAWQFYVLPRTTIAALGQKSMRLSTVHRLAGDSISLDALDQAVTAAARENTTGPVT